jgi:hypothetical protein
VPSAFIWPAVAVECYGVDQPTLTYPTRGVAALWQEAPAHQTDPLGALVGRTRATLLATLGLPRTTTSRRPSSASARPRSANTSRCSRRPGW